MQLAIFLVEDDPEQRDALIPLLSELGASSVVGVAESEDEAIQWLQKNEGQWDLVVLDLILKFGTGFGVLQRMPHHHRTRVTVLSNSASATNRSRCLEFGASAVFDKTQEIPAFLDHCERFRRVERPGSSHPR